MPARVAALALFLVACTPAEPAAPDGGGAAPDADPDDGMLVPIDPGDPGSPHLGLGIPIDGTPDDDHLLVHDQMAIGYSRYLNAASWVSWRTRPVDFGPVERFDGDFYPDTSLPPGWYQATHADLYGSGYDRGHMLRSEERTRTAAENYATFVMTNVLPQRADLNRGPWFDFERYVQRKVESFSSPKDAYVIAGAVWPAACATHAPRIAGDGCRDVGQSSDPTRRIAVPEATWKVAVFVDAGVPLAEAVAPRVVGVLMPNGYGIEEVPWWEYRASVATIEATSGYDIPAVE